MHFLRVCLLACLCYILQLQSFVLPAFASHIISKRQSELVDVLWSGRLNEPYLTARISSSANSHVLCHRHGGPVSLVFSRGPSGATYGFTRINATFSSDAAAALDEQLPSLSARYQRSRDAKVNAKLDVVVTDAETAKRADDEAPMLFTSAEYGRACL